MERRPFHHGAAGFEGEVAEMKKLFKWLVVLVVLGGVAIALYAVATVGFRFSSLCGNRL